MHCILKSSAPYGTEAYTMRQAIATHVYASAFDIFDNASLRMGFESGSETFHLNVNVDEYLGEDAEDDIALLGITLQYGSTQSVHVIFNEIMECIYEYMMLNNCAWDISTHFANPSDAYFFRRIQTYRLPYHDHEIISCESHTISYEVDGDYERKFVKQLEKCDADALAAASRADSDVARLEAIAEASAKADENVLRQWKLLKRYHNGKGKTLGMGQSNMGRVVSGHKRRQRL